jgi:hypothetical protein
LPLLHFLQLKQLREAAAERAEGGNQEPEPPDFGAHHSGDAENDRNYQKARPVKILVIALS